MDGRLKLKSRPGKRPPYGFGFGIGRDLAASKRMDYVACNDWTNALIDADNAKREKQFAEASAHIARADAIRTRLISAWVLRKRDQRFKA